METEAVCAISVLFDLYCMKYPDVKDASKTASQRKYAFLMMSHMQDGKTMLESEIRKKWGNTPDVSKALRILVSLGYLQRTGSGGRQAPFQYIMQ